MKFIIHLILLSLLIFFSAHPVMADMVFPARLELVESQPGVFDVQFNLPVQNQKRIKATPVLPDICSVTEPPVETYTEFNYTLQFKMNCAADDLPGQTIGVDGLLGSQIDVLLSVKTLSGRQYNAVLKPSQARYVFAQPPSFYQLSGQALIDGMENSFVRGELYLLIWLIVLFGRRHGKWVIPLIVGGIFYGVAQALAGENLLLLPATLPKVLTLIMVVYFINRLINEGHIWQKNPIPAWLIGALMGLLYGGAQTEFQPALEFSSLEQGMAFSFYITGIISGLLVILLLCVEFRYLLGTIKILNDSFNEPRIVATITGIGALGLLIYQLSAFSLLPTLIPAAPPIFFLTAIISGMYMTRINTKGLLISPATGLLMTAGLIAGALGYSLPWEEVMVPLILFALGIGLLTKGRLPDKIAIIIMGLGAVYSAAQAGGFIQENLSKPMAHMAGSGILAIFIFLAGSSVVGKQGTRFSLSIRLAGGIGAVLALLVWGQNYASWFNTTFITDYAMGFIRIPILSLVLILAAAIACPRRSKVAVHLNLAAPKPIGHIVLVVMAVFLLNVGTIQAKNPMFVQDVPRPEQARLILETVLTNTYTAFNLKDEEQLYKQLSASVGDDLVEDLYLDSRRRLTSGVRQGSEVTVQNVSVLKVSDTGQDTAGIPDQFAYEAQWVVTARVRHLQHVHHRKNLYTGVLTIRVTDKKWKVQRVELKSEKRTVIPGRS